MDMQSAEQLMMADQPDSGMAWSSREVFRLKLYLCLLAVDICMLMAAFAIAGMLRFGNLMADEAVLLGSLTIIVYSFVALTGQAFSLPVLRDGSTSLTRSLRSVVLAVLVVLFFAFFLKSGEQLSRATMGFALASAVVTLSFGRLLFDGYVGRAHGRQLTDELVIFDNRRVDVPMGMAVLDVSGGHLRPDASDPIMLDRLSRLLRRYDRVVVVCTEATQYAWMHVLKGMDCRAEVCGTVFDFAPEYNIGRFSGFPTAQVSTGSLSLPNRLLKRGLDIALTLPVLIFLAPALVAVAVAVKLDSPGPVFFRQQRMGKGNRLFTMYKFRSMKTDMCDSTGSRSASVNDDRVTRVGRVIRSTSIDELPQLLNVLRGEMSLVGPRPHALGSTVDERLFWNIDNRYWHRHTLQPGLTGLAQIRGYRGATRQIEDLTRRVQADLEYISNWSLAKDIYILVATFRVMIHRNAF